MNISYERTKQTTDEWYTPPSIFEKLGHFDLDPCASESPLWKIAEHNFTKQDDGLKQIWRGRVWLNPPYSRPMLETFVKRLAEHGNGIALLFNRCDCKLFQDVIFKQAHGILFVKGRIKFFTQSGTQTGTSGCGSVLIAFGQKNSEILKSSGIPGCFFYINN